MAFNIWMSDSNNRKRFPTKISLEMITEYILSIHHRHSFTNKQICKMVTETHLVLAVISPSVSVLLSRTMSHVLLLPFEA